MSKILERHWCDAYPFINDPFSPIATRWGDDGGLAIFKHDGDPRGPWRKQVIKDNWSNATQAIFADIDGDGRLDIVATSERGANEVRWWRNEGPAG